MTSGDKSSAMIISHPQKPMNSRKSAIRGRALALLICVLGSFAGSRGVQAAEDITVETPSQDLQAGDHYTVKWEYSSSGSTTGDLNSFAIELRDCGSDGSGCDGDASCGDEYMDLCTIEGGCMDSDGSYDVELSEDITAGEYAIMVYLTDSVSVSGCSEAFSIAASDNDTDEATLSVITPESLTQGEAFTAHWIYDNGSGDGEGTFEINLYSCADNACDDDLCGDYATSLCDEDAGCYDPGTGDYDVVIPDSQEVGSYKMQVRVSEDVLTACSNSTFWIGEPTEATPSPSPGEDSVTTTAPTPVPTATARLATTPAPVSRSPSVAPTVPARLTPMPVTTNVSAAPTILTHPTPMPVISPSAAPTALTPPTTMPVTINPSAAPTALTPPTMMPVTNNPSAAPTVPTPPTPIPVAVMASPAPTSLTPPTPMPVTNTPSAAPAAQVPTANPQPAPTSSPNIAPTAGPNPSPTPGPVSSSSSTTDETPGTPPTPVPAKVECETGVDLSFTYSEEDTKLPLITIAHASGTRGDNGCVTLTDVWNYVTTSGDADLPTDLLYTVDPDTGVEDTDLSATPTGTWLLKCSLKITNGVTLAIKGTSNSGGDCDELKLSSTVKKWYRIEGHGGNIDIYDTLIRSWDESKMKEHIFKDSATGKDSRSYISCVSEVADDDETCDGVAQNNMGECRMDIISSELGYLGYDDTESYGVTWKVRGLCDDASNSETLFENVRVYGDLQDSKIHNMWYGMYSFGHYGGVWTNNDMYENRVYGFDPHDDSDYLTIAHNRCWDNGNHGIIASKRCDHLLVHNNTCYDNEGSGIMLHKSCDDSIVSDNYCYGNKDGGISLVETLRTEVTGNTFEDNRWGFRVTLASSYTLLEGNTLIENRYADIYAYIGSDDEVAEVAPYTGINVGNVYNENTIYYLSSIDYPVDMEDSDMTEITNNEFIGEEDQGQFSFISSDNTYVSGNTGPPAEAEPQVTDSCFTAETGWDPVCD